LSFSRADLASANSPSRRSAVSSADYGAQCSPRPDLSRLAVVFGVRLPCALTAAFVNQALKASEGAARLSAAMRGLIAARTAVMTAVAAIDADMSRMTRASSACRRLMTIPGVGHLIALVFVAAIDDPSRIRRSRDVGGLRDRQAIDDAKGPSRSGASPRNHHARNAARTELSSCLLRLGNQETGGRNRRLLVLDAISVLRAAPKRKGALCDWLAALRARKPAKVVAVALANKLARIVWAIITTGEAFEGLVPIRGNALEKRTQAQEFGERDDDVMNDTARRSKTIGHSAMGQEPRASPLDREPRVVGLHQGQRTQSAPTGRTYDRRPPAVHRRNKNACQAAVHL
jgi:hypothetical protein